MGTAGKIIIGMVIGVLLVGAMLTAGAVFTVRAAGEALGEYIETGADKAEAAVQTMADFTLPEGWKYEFSANAAGVTIVNANPVNGRGHIYLAQVSRDLPLDSGEIKARLQEAAQLPDDRNPAEKMRLIGQSTATVRGQQVTIYQQEGINSDQQRYYMSSAFFEGKNGPAAASILLTVDQWDEAFVQDFFSSIR